MFFHENKYFWIKINKNQKDFLNALEFIFMIIFQNRIINYQIWIHGASQWDGKYSEVTYLKLDEYIEKFPILKKNILKWNSYEKISWENFIYILEWEIPNINKKEFWIHMCESFTVEDAAMIARLVSDFKESDYWIEYLVSKKMDTKS